MVTVWIPHYLHMPLLLLDGPLESVDYRIRYVVYNMYDNKGLFSFVSLESEV